MPSAYSLLGTGYSPLGPLGLDFGGAYSSLNSYFPSYMNGMNNMGMGMNSSLFNGMGMGMGMNSSLFNGMGGMFGMYDPLYYTRLQEEMEKAKLNHASVMHQGVLQNEVKAHTETDNALIDKILTNGTVHLGINTLYLKVREGDMDGVCSEFDKLRQTILDRYGDEIKARGKEINPYTAVTKLIQDLYSQVVTTEYGQTTASLIEDMERYGEGYFENGFKQGWYNNHSKRSIEDAKLHCFGLEINNIGSNEAWRNGGQIVGAGCSAITKSAMVGAGAAASVGIASAVGKNFLPDKLTNSISNLKPFRGKTTWQVMKKAGKWGALAGIVGDIVWQCAK